MSELTDEQQVERLKAWWQENGRSLLFIIGLGMVGAIGWLQWQGSQRDNAEAASALYELAMEAADRNDSIVLGQRVDELTGDYPDSTYTALAVLRQVAVELANGETELARAKLDALLTSEKGSELEPLIALRLARVELYLGNAEQALAVLDKAPAKNFAPFYHEVRGDIYVQLGQAQDARDAYQAALDEPGQPQLVDVNYIGIKLAQLATTEAVVAETP
ncbi:MAG: YfgM family protein [Woeseiaceae bacterium]